MAARAVILRRAAEQDIADAHDRYRKDAGLRIGAFFLDDAEHTFRRIEAFPEAGSSRYGDLPTVSGARCQAMARFPYLVFYLIGETQLDVMRVLHQRRDLFAVLGRG
jgi:toxin ParE1/3/4